MDDLKLNVVHEEDIYVYDGSGQPVTGLTQADFHVVFIIAGVKATKTYTITEVNATDPDTKGHYRLLFAPDVKAIWTIRVWLDLYNLIGWQGHYRIVDKLAEDITLQQLGPGNQRVNLRVLDEASEGPIAGAYLEVYDVTGTTKIAFAYTDGNGYTPTLMLYNGSYRVYISQIGQYVFTNPFALTVDEDGESAVYMGQRFTPSAPPTPDTCIVYGWELDSSGHPIQTLIRAEVIASDYFLENNPHIVRGPIEVLSDPLNGGYWEMALTRSDQYVGGTARYLFIIGGWQQGNYTIPAQSAIAFKDLVAGGGA